MTLNRCAWGVSNDALYTHYHDTEWGVPVRGEHALFERLCLEGAQAGLSWITILRKRENYRALFDGFDPEKVVRYDDEKIAALLQNPGIVRNRAKVNAAVNNAGRFLDVQQAFGSFSVYLWDFVDGKPIQNAWRSMAELPAETPISQKMSKDLLKRGFKFVGPTICYAAMQACGLVNDHTVDCFRYTEVAAMA